MKLKNILALTTAAVGFAALAAQAQTTSEWEGNAYARYTTSYVFRGDKKAGQSMEGNIEFKPVATKDGFFVGAWINQPFASERNFEFDLYGGYRYNVSERIVVDAGLTGFFYPQSSGGITSYSYEFNVSASYMLMKNWGVTASVYYDVRLQALTAELSTGYRIPYKLTSKWIGSLDFSAFAGNSGVKNYFPDANLAAKRKDNYSYYGATVSTTVFFNPNWSVSVGIQYGDTINKAWTPVTAIDRHGTAVKVGGYGKDTSDNLYGYVSVGIRW